MTGARGEGALIFPIVNGFIASFWCKCNLYFEVDTKLMGTELPG